MPGARSARRTEAAFAAGTVAATAAAVTVTLQLWRAHARVPFVYSFDALFNGIVVKGLITQGWYLRNPSLGAPAGLELHDFPLGGDNLQYLLIKGLGLFSRDWALVMNAYFLAGFLLVALATFAVLRQLGAGRWTSSALGVMFTLLPFHLVLGETQLFQTAYFAVPLGGFLVLDAMGWDVWGGPLLTGTAEGRPRARRWRWTTRAVLVAVVASAGSYYAPFTMVLVLVGCGLTLSRRGHRRALRALAVVAGLGAVLLANNLPSVLYERQHGPNPLVGQRAPGESDLYALRVVDLFLPAQGHRLAGLAAVRERLDDLYPVSPVWPAPQTPLGAAGAAGLALSLAAVVTAARPSRPRPLSPARARLAHLGLVNLAIIVIGVSTGLASLLAIAGYTAVRVWSRLSIFVAFFAFVALAQALPGIGARLAAAGRRRGLARSTTRLLGAALAGGGFLLALADQTQPAIVPTYAKNLDVYGGDRFFVNALEEQLEPGSAVFQLPLASFPEQPTIARMRDYGLARGYLSSRTLRWSYAAIRGRPADWTWSLGGRSVAEVVDAVAAAGFAGLYVDRNGFFDSGADLDVELGRLVGPPSAIGENGLAFWDLRPYAAEQRARLGDAVLARRREEVLHPVRPGWVQFGAPVTSPPDAFNGDFPVHPSSPDLDTTSERPTGPEGILELHNPLDRPRPVRLEAEVRTLNDATVLRTVFSEGTQGRRTMALDDEARPLRLDLVLPPGTSRLRLLSSGGRLPSLGLANVQVIDTSIGALPTTADPP